MLTTLISATDLKTLLTTGGQGGVIIFDCRHSLDDPDAGYRAYREGHIPGALFASLDHDLASAAMMTEAGHSGRHPLPDAADWMRRLGEWGVTPDTQVITYDDSGGSIASRMWWMLRSVGHEAVAVLNGGLQAWTGAGGALERGVRKPTPAVIPYPGQFRAEWVVDMDRVKAQVATDSPELVLVDARSANRYRGDGETLDPVAGHIPGAISMPYQGNLNPDGTFRAADELRARFAPLFDAAGDREIVSYCGSGVTACHNMLAMEIAGLPAVRLFPGSWSAWSRTPGLPTAKGDR